MRIILSGQAEVESTLQAICTSHQYLSKPCDINRLEELLSAKTQSQRLVCNPQLQDFVAQISHLPCQPRALDRLEAEMNSDTPSSEQIWHLISNDIAMSLRILQIANSAYFSPKKEIVCPFQAVTILGVNLLKSLMEVSGIFKRSIPLECPVLEEQFNTLLGAINTHSIAVGNLARRLALVESAPAKDAVICYTAGLLRDVGKIVLMLFVPTEYLKLLNSDKKHSPIHADHIEGERTLFGTTHSEVGAYLLGMWGLPQSIVEVAQQHSLSRIEDISIFSVSAAVRIADALDQMLDAINFERLESGLDLRGYRELFRECVNGSVQHAQK